MAGSKGRRKHDSLDLYETMLSEFLPKVRDVTDVDRDTLLGNDKFNVFFDENGKQLSFRDAREMVRKFLEYHLSREPSKKELEIGFNTWRSYMSCNSSNLHGKTVKLRGGRRIQLRSNKQTTKKFTDIREVEEAVLSAVRGDNR